MCMRAASHRRRASEGLKGGWVGLRGTGVCVVMAMGLRLRLCLSLSVVETLTSTMTLPTLGKGGRPDMDCRELHLVA